MTEKEYGVFAFRQQKNSPIQVAFVAPAGEILQWAGVPRKTDDLLAGYQRFLDDARVDSDIVPFFQDSRNCSPTAIIVALRSEGALGKCWLDNENIPAGKIVSTTLRIEFDEDAINGDRIFEIALEFVDSRLGQEKLQDADSGEEDEADLDFELDAEESDHSANIFASSRDSDDDVQLGSSTLVRMKRMLEDRQNWSKENFRKSIVDFVKPAFLIDGQHRAFAAAKLGPNGLPFMVCGLLGASWQEQVFHFTVVNLRPRRILPATITGIAGLSLTQSEQLDLADRLKQAGIKMSEVKVMSKVAYEKASPFYELVDMALGKKNAVSGKLGYGVIKRVAMVWSSAKRVSLINIAKRLAATESAFAAREAWLDDDTWFRFFCVFWNEIKSRHSLLWGAPVGSNRLFVGAHLWALQEALLLSADSQMAEFWEPEASTRPEEMENFLMNKLVVVVRNGLKHFPDEMWRKEWKTGLDTNVARKDLVTLFQRFMQEGLKSNTGIWRNWANDEFFKGAEKAKNSKAETRK